MPQPLFFVLKRSSSVSGLLPLWMICPISLVLIQTASVHRSTTYPVHTAWRTSAIWAPLPNGYRQVLDRPVAKLISFHWTPQGDDSLMIRKPRQHRSVEIQLLPPDTPTTPIIRITRSHTPAPRSRIRIRHIRMIHHLVSILILHFWRSSSTFSRIVDNPNLLGVTVNACTVRQHPIFKHLSMKFRMMS